MAKKKARLRTVLALAIPNQKGGKRIYSFEGKIRGVITTEPKEKLIGGYPFRSIFYLPKFKKIFAQLSFQEKTKISRRKKVAQKVTPILKNYLNSRKRCAPKLKL